jgi:hypothetical protein
MCDQFKQLPSQGSVLDQPARLMHLFEGIMFAKAERDTKDAKEQEREAKRSARKR